MIFIQKIVSNWPFKEERKRSFEMLNVRAIHICSDQATGKINTKLKRRVN